MDSLANGFYNSPNFPAFLLKISGEKVETFNCLVVDYPDLEPKDANGSINFGDFGPAQKEIFDASDKQTGNYNFHIKYSAFKSKGIVDKNRKTFHILGPLKGVATFKWMSQEDLKSFAENREPLEAPSCPYYKIQPENQGKLIWLSGPPGAGKSTTGALMGRKGDFVYYEADCVANFVNPFVDPNSEHPSMAGMTQQPLKGVPKSLLNDVEEGTKPFKALAKGKMKTLNWDQTKPFFKAMAEDISRQKKRIGGNFVIANAVPSRRMRDYIKETIPECIFVTLTLTKETQLARVKKRYTQIIGDESKGALDFFLAIYKYYEGPAEDEINTFNLDISEDMTPDDVMEKVVELLK